MAPPPIVYLPRYLCLIQSEDGPPKRSRSGDGGMSLRGLLSGIPLRPNPSVCMRPSQCRARPWVRSPLSAPRGAPSANNLGNALAFLVVPFTVYSLGGIPTGGNGPSRSPAAGILLPPRPDHCLVAGDPTPGWGGGAVAVTDWFSS